MQSWLASESSPSSLSGGETAAFPATAEFSSAASAVTGLSSAVTGFSSAAEFSDAAGFSSAAEASEAAERAERAEEVSERPGSASSVSASRPAPSAWIATLQFQPNSNQNAGETFEKALLTWRQRALGTARC